MFQKFFAIAAGVAAAGALVLGAGAANASTSVSPTIVYDHTGVAGYYSFTTRHFTEVSTHVTLTQTGWALGQGATGPNVYGQGIGLCNESGIGLTADLGAVANPGSPGFQVKWGVGTGTQTNSLTPSQPCVQTPPPASSSLSPVLNASVGDTLSLTITDFNGSIEFTAVDLTTDTGVSKAFDTETGLQFPDVALAGASELTTGLSAPASNPVANFANLTATDVAGTTGGFGNWNPVTAVDNAAGVSGDPALLTPDALVTVNGPRVCHTVRFYHPHIFNGHHYRYITRHICSQQGDVSSSFNIFAGSEIS